MFAQNPHNIMHASTVLTNAREVPNARNAEDATNVFITPESEPINTTQPIPFWSSYRFLHAPTRTWFWLPRLRPIFGTQARTFHTGHPSRVLPSIPPPP